MSLVQAEGGPRSSIRRLRACATLTGIFATERRTHTRRVMDGGKEKGWMQEGDGAREKLKEEHGERQWQRERNTEVHIVHVVSTLPLPPAPVCDMNPRRHIL